MTLPRKNQVSLIDTPYYHCVSRCVRRSFLCGEDKFTGQSFEHRRGWVEERLFFLASVFAIDICAYAVMSNHTYVVVCVDKDLADSWSMDEVIRRWQQMYQGTLLSQKYQIGDTTPETSKHTSIQQCIHSLIKGEQPKKLMRVVGNHRQDMSKGIAYSLIGYCELVDCTGRCIRDDKAGYIEHHNSPILARLGLDTEKWLTLTTEFEEHFSTAVDSEHMLQQFIHHTDHQRIRGMAKARVLLQQA